MNEMTGLSDGEVIAAMMKAANGGRPTPSSAVDYDFAHLVFRRLGVTREQVQALVEVTDESDGFCFADTRDARPWLSLVQRLGDGS